MLLIVPIILLLYPNSPSFTVFSRYLRTILNFSPLIILFYFLLCYSPDTKNKRHSKICMLLKVLNQVQSWKFYCMLTYLCNRRLCSKIYILYPIYKYHPYNNYIHPRNIHNLTPFHLHYKYPFRHSIRWNMYWDHMLLVLQFSSL